MRRRSVAILMVALMALTVVSTAGIGAAAPTPQAKYPYINLIYIDRTKVRAGSISIGRGTGQFAIVLNRGLRNQHILPRNICQRAQRHHCQSL